MSSENKVLADALKATTQALNLEVVKNADAARRRAQSDPGPANAARQGAQSAPGTQPGNPAPSPPEHLEKDPPCSGITGNGLHLLIGLTVVGMGIFAWYGTYEAKKPKPSNGTDDADKNSHSHYNADILPTANTVAAALLSATLLDEDTTGHVEKLFKERGKEWLIQRCVALVVLAALIVPSALSPSQGVSVGLCVAVGINFIMDGIMASDEMKGCTPASKSGGGTGSLVQGKMMGYGKILGYMADNLVLMLVLGFQFQKAALGTGKMWGIIVAFLLVFVVSMYGGIWKGAPKKGSGTARSVKTVTVIVIIYTIFCELMPEANTFEQPDGTAIPEDEQSSYQKNYGTYIQACLFFGVLMAYKTLDARFG